MILVANRVARGVSILPAPVAGIAGVLQWLSVRGQPLDPDAQAFLALASTASPLSAASMPREPLWPAILAFPVAVFGQQADIARLTGVVGFVAMIVAFQLLAGRLVGGLLASIGSLCLAVSPWMVYQSARGLREETAAALIMLFALAVLPSHWSVQRAILLGVLSGFTALLRWDSLLITMPVVLLAVAAHRLSMRAAATLLFTCIVLVSPLLVGNYVQRGDPVYFSNQHAAFFRNIEFHDKPGFPTSADIAVNGFAGPPTTWARYLFGLHTPVEIARRTAWGVAAVPYGTVSLSMFRASGQPVAPDQALASVTNMLKVVAAVLVIAAGAVGGALLLIGPNWPIAVILALAAGEFAPIAALFDPRLALTFVPFLLLGVLTAVSAVARFAGHRRPAPARESMRGPIAS